MSDNTLDASATQTGLSPTVEPASSLAGSAASIRSAGMYLAYADMLAEQGVWAEGCSVFTCGATSGHFVRPIAFCDRPETARALASAMSAFGQDLQGLEAQPASAVPQADAHTQPESH